MVKAAVMVKPGRIEVQEFPYPVVADDAMLMKVELSGICGTDKHSYRGETKQYAGTNAEMSIPFPIIPGHEIVGTIVEVGKYANRAIKTYGQTINKGDRVVICPDIFCGRCYYCRNYSGFIWCDNMRTYGVSMTCATPPHLFGGWAEYLYILPGTFVYKVPESISTTAAVLTEPMTVTYNLDKAKEFYSMSGDGFKTGDTVVIQGVGSLGLLHAIKARMLGAGDIIAIDSSEFRLNMAKEFGVDICLNISKTTQKERIEAVKTMTHGIGADVVVECTGVPVAIKEGLALVRKGGMYIVTGMFVDKGEISINPHRDLCAKNIRLIGQTNHPPSGYLPSLKLMEKFAKFFPPFEKIVTHKFPLDRAAEAMDLSMNADLTMKVAIAPQAGKNKE
jgi:L-iditol 2-dehydrogenase